MVPLANSRLEDSESVRPGALGALVSTFASALAEEVAWLPTLSEIL